MSSALWIPHYKAGLTNAAANTLFEVAMAADGDLWEGVLEFTIVVKTAAAHQTIAGVARASASRLPVAAYSVPAPHHTVQHKHLTSGTFTLDGFTITAGASKVTVNLDTTTGTSLGAPTLYAVRLNIRPMLVGRLPITLL